MGVFLYTDTNKSGIRKAATAFIVFSILFVLTVLSVYDMQY